MKNLLNQTKLKIICLGLNQFYEDLKKQEVQVVKVNWKPPAGGDKKLIALLAKLS